MTQGTHKPLSRTAQYVEPLVERIQAGSSDILDVFGAAADRIITAGTLEEKSQINPADSVFLIAHRMDMPAPTHSHDFFEILFVLRGQVVNRIDGRDTYMQSGSACIMNLNATHELLNPDPQAIVLNIGIRPTFFHEGVAQKFTGSANTIPEFFRENGLHPYLFLSDNTERLIHSSLTCLIQAYATSGFSETVEVDAWTLLVLCALEKVEEYSFSGIDDQTKEMLDYIGRAQGRLSLADLAEAFGYNENYVGQYLRNHTGRKASAILREARLAHARDLLSETDLGMEHIAHECGYASYSRFNQVFREEYGTTPAAWRKARRAL